MDSYGFITNVKDLEYQLLTLKDEDIPLLKIYRILVNGLDNKNSNALELKAKKCGLRNSKLKY